MASSATSTSSSSSSFVVTRPADRVMRPAPGADPRVDYPPLVVPASWYTGVHELPDNQLVDLGRRISPWLNVGSLCK